MSISLTTETEKHCNIEHQPSTFQDLLHGPNAFYKETDYISITQDELSRTKALPAVYMYNTEYGFLHKVAQVAKKVFIFVIFPIGLYTHFYAFTAIAISTVLYKFFQSVAATFILMSSDPSKAVENAIENATLRKNIPLNTEWKYKRFTVGVNRDRVDAMIIGKPSTLGNGRWVLYSNGNNEHYEDKPYQRDFKLILNELNSNAIVFNYPGVGASSGSVSKQIMTNAYQAMLTFLEDEKMGIGAKKIIGYGHSIGGGIQGEALRTHQLKEGIKYVFVKSRTFSDLSTLVSHIYLRALGFLVKILGWNIESITSSKKLRAPEIILQTAQVENYEELKNSSKIIDDIIIPANGSLAKILLDANDCPMDNKTFIGMKEKHNDELRDPSYLAEKINALLGNP